VSTRAAAPDFTRDIKPILDSACVSCHGPEKQKGNLRLDQRRSAFGVGESGERIIIPHRSADSLLIELVASDDPEERMPRKADPLTTEQIALLRRWVDVGAPWPDDGASVVAASEMIVTARDREHWAFRPLLAAAPPTRDGNPVDAFIRAALHARDLDLAPRLDRAREIRRVYFDLVGLPPTLKEVGAYVADASPDAYERLVDRLLARPAYGERWARHWLDLARYADSGGYEPDKDRNAAWPYRDWVIRAWDADMPFDQFVRWQLAGDELAPDDPDAVIATGFLAAGPYLETQPTESDEEKRRVRYDNLDDIVSTTGSAFLGLTIGCARCHDHKYDPIPTRDYYRLGTAFLSGEREEVSTHRGQRQLDRWLAQQRAALREEKMAALKISDSDRVLLRVPLNPNNQTQKNTFKRWDEKLQFTDADLRAWLSPTQQTQLAALEQRARSVLRRTPEKTFAFLDDSAEPTASWLLGRGDARTLTEEVSLGILQVLQGAKSAPAYLDAARRAARTTDSTLQRTALALWITDPVDGAGHLLARVIVNRLWQQHFGQGLVRTPNDFGLQGDTLIRGGWKLKPIQRLVVTSAVYRQGGLDRCSEPAVAARRAKDPDNRLLSYRRPLRLEAETLRDAMLSIGGVLNGTMGGPGIKPPIPAFAQATRSKDKYPSDDADGPELWRRSIYLFTKRSVRLPFMEVFDAPEPIASSGRRQITTVPAQQLTLLNDDFVRCRAANFAARLVDAGEDNASRITRAFELALARPPTATELARSVAFLERGGWNDFCHALFTLNAFIYVD
jgi:hypothetical protein